MPRATTRDRLISTMSTSLRTSGYGGTSMKTLLGTAGISSGSMYHSFPGGKEELAEAAVREVGLDAAGRIRAVFDGAPSVADGLARIFDALAADLEGHGFTMGCPIGVPATEAVGVSDAIRAACREVFAAWAQAYEDALVAEGWARDEAASLGVAIVVLYEGAVTVARTLMDTAPVRQAKAQVVAMVSAGGGG